MSTLLRRRRRRRLIERDGAKCKECDRPDQGIMSNGHSFLTIDHIKPTREGGNHKLWNLQLLCWRCHSRKDSMPKGTNPHALSRKRIAKNKRKRQKQIERAVKRRHDPLR